MEIERPSGIAPCRIRTATDPRVRSIKLGYAVAQASEKGWDCPQIKEIIKEARDFLHLSEKETIRTIHESARAAAEITESYGAKKISRLVLLPVEAVHVRRHDQICTTGRRRSNHEYLRVPIKNHSTVQPPRPLHPGDVGERRRQHGAFHCSGGHLSRNRHGQGRFCAAHAGPAVFSRESTDWDGWMKAMSRISGSAQIQR